MKNKTRLFGIYLPLFAIATIAAVIMRSIACLEHFNSFTNYFENKSLITAANIVIVCASIFLFTYVFIAPKDIKLIPSFTTPATFVPTGIVTVALAFMMMFMFNNAQNIREAIKIANTLSSNYRDQISSLTMNMVICYAAALFALLGALHFILAALLEKISSSARANFGLCSVAFFALYAIYLYFSTDLPINAPNKLLDQMVYLFAALFFLFETRLSIGREKWREYIAFGFISAMLAAYSSIPTLITYFTDGICVSNNIYESLLSFSIFVFITARILLTGELIEDKESPIVAALSAFAEKRDETVSANTELALAKEEAKRLEEELAVETEQQQNDENQITIDDIFNTSEVEETDAEDTKTSEDAQNDTEDIEKQETTDEEKDTGN